ncbi:MAG: hypothetical protein UFA98_06475 [Ruminococcus sp.]|nr:hypothetical protein [Ruminococcus sp.]
MGYFSNYALEFFDYFEDNGFPSPEMELLWRLDDLKDQLEELIADGAPYQSGYNYTDDDIRCALPEHLCYVSDDQLYIGDISMVKRAIELAKKDLLNEYRINVYEDERSLMDSVVPGTEYVYFTLFDMFAPVIYLSRTISELLVARIINNT